jgi:hypothetical protein
MGQLDSTCTPPTKVLHGHLRTRRRDGPRDVFQGLSWLGLETLQSTGCKEETLQRSKDFAFGQNTFD